MKLEEFFTHLEVLCQDSLILSKINNQDLPPDELKNIILVESENECNQLSIKNWQNAHLDKFGVH